MSVDEQVTRTQNPSEFFETIGDKVKNFGDTNGASNEAEDAPPVQEIESLCMNCQQNVRISSPFRERG